MKVSLTAGFAVSKTSNLNSPEPAVSVATKSSLNTPESALATGGKSTFSVGILE